MDRKYGLFKKQKGDDKNRMFKDEYTEKKMLISPNEPVYRALSRC